jgi:hypothetical protein
VAVASLAAFGNKFGNFPQNASNGMVRAGGMAGKKAGLDAAKEDLGGDRAMSNLKRGRARLNVGYDQVGSTSVRINFRGPWKLADEGRRASGTIRPRRGRALRMPDGSFRARSRYGTSRGLNTLDDAISKARREVPRAAAKAFRAAVAGVAGAGAGALSAFGSGGGLPRGGDLD